MSLRHGPHERAKTSPDDEIAWGALACVYGQLPRVSAELLLLSEGMIEDRLGWLKAGEEARREMVNRILLAGGLTTFDRKWIEIG